MRVRALDSNHDWTFGRGKNDYFSSRNAVKQNIKTRVLSFYNDCFFALNDGIDWFALLGTKNRIGLEVAVNATILNTQDVLSVIQVLSVLDPVTRNLTLQYEVETSFGVVAEELPIPIDLLLTEDGDPIVTEDGEFITT